MRRAFKIIFLVFLNLLLVLLGLEAGVRIFDIPPRPLAALPINSYQLSNDPIIGYEFIPNYSPEDTPFDESHRGYKINKEGFRDYDYAALKKKGVKRIIVLGDSTTAGSYVPDMENIYPKILEKMLNGQNDPKAVYEVLNMGVGGYHTLQEVETLKAKGLKYKPDLVILCYCLNDEFFRSDAGTLGGLWAKNQHFKEGKFYSFSNALLKKSRLAFILHYYLSNLIDDMNYLDTSPTQAEQSYAWYKANILKGKNPMELGLQMLSDLQKEYHFTAVVVILPSFVNPFDKYRMEALHANVFKASRDLSNIKVIDLKNYFQHVNNSARVFGYDGCHLNEYGHKIMAQILFHVLKNQLDFGN